PRQIVQIVKIDVVDGVDPGFYVPGDGDVDEEDGAILACTDEPRHVLEPQNRLGGRRGRYHDVEPLQRLQEPLEGLDRTAEALRQLEGPRSAPVRDHYRVRPALHQSARRQLPHLAGADEEDP